LILVIGANGYVGRALCRQLLQSNTPMRAVVRTVRGDEPVPVEIVSPSASDAAWQTPLRGVSCVVHLAARTPTHGESGMESLGEFREANVSFPLRVARNAGAAGVRRFVFLSSVKVHGDVANQPLTEKDAPRPVDAYGISKVEAEQEVRQAAQGAGMEWVILRPPVVYGPGVRGNFPALVRAIQRRLPLPLGAIRNRRSIIYLGNLVDVVQRCVTHSAAANQLFLVADHEALSTPALVRRLALALGVEPPYLPWVPVWMLRAAGRALGRRATVERLTQSLEIDSSFLKDRLGWTPPFAAEEGFADMAKWFGAMAPRR
jgi:nucleoside-diphosphate-sugar epimerase